ncbi:PepSY domain-containing protein [Calidifontibacillus oryziterrae]|uniref:PepSY domain-containing protein n=1 Tax=Calidifontibacillus oryziterrae TaxID=1191699 RepID=UPI0002D83B2C|nr:PepSY domain-containing protein [Calidifontibacillus oryziterrae]
MRLNQLLLGLGIGAIAGAYVNQKYMKNHISSETALKIVKKAFKDHGPIDGSWIHMKPEKVNKFNLSYNVYRGGITRTIDSKVEQYEFLVDSKTGTIIDVYAL